MVLAILLLLVMTLLGMAATTVALMEYRDAVRQHRRDGTLYAADSGIEYAAAMLDYMPPGTPYAGGAMPARVNGADVTIARPIFVLRGHDEDIYAVAATARLGRIIRSVSAHVAVIPGMRGHSRIFDWKEVPPHPPRRRTWRWRR